MVVVLVVSGEGKIRRHVRSVLGSRGWWVTSASDREEALRASADQQPALAIVDCEVEGAAELVRTFGAKNGGPGVLLLEPPGESDKAFHAFEAGADQILSKPPQAEPLLEAAQRVMSLPHQSGGALAADMGEKLSASEIFGELLVELEETDPGSSPVPSPPMTESEVEPAESAVPLAPPTPPTPPTPPVPPAPVDVSEPAPPPEAADEGLEEAEVDEPEKAQEISAVSAGSGPDPAGASSEMFDPRVLGEDFGPIEAPAPREPAKVEVESATSDEREDFRFGQYRLEERVAVGGMAEVWRASMLGLEGFRKTVAIKKILPHLAENSEFVTMFIEEAKLAAQLSHENLVEIYDLGKIGESFFIAMEYVDGKDLRGLLNRFRQGSDSMPIGLALLVAAQVARGLEYAHTREDEGGNPLDLVHRDVSPRNVLIGNDGRVRLCDFGVAKAVSSVIQTQIGALKGKLQYMSPEQASGRPVDNRSDIYSLGSVMYEMISGRRLYDADNEISLLDAVRAGNFDDPRKHCPGLPQEVRRILVKALAKKPSARYQSAGDLERDLRALLGTLDPAPNEQMLSAFVRELFADPVAAEPSFASDGAIPSAVTASLEGAVTDTRSLERRFGAGRVVRFWWGVAAGLLAAGLVAALFKLLFG